MLPSETRYARRPTARSPARRLATIPIVGLTLLIALAGTLPSTATASPLSCRTAQPGEQCNLALDIVATPSNWALIQSDSAWTCTPPPLGDTDHYDASCDLTPPLPFQIICVSVTVIARAAGSGSVSVTGHCNPLPSASCTASTAGGVDVCTRTHVATGVLPSVCFVRKAGLVAGDGTCIFTYAVF